MKKIIISILAVLGVSLGSLVFAQTAHASSQTDACVLYVYGSSTPAAICLAKGPGFSWNTVVKGNGRIDIFPTTYSCSNATQHNSSLTTTVGFVNSTWIIAQGYVAAVKAGSDPSTYNCVNDNVPFFVANYGVAYGSGFAVRL